jgi:ATP-dependent Clp protease ATP-binding subunit ClpB
VADLRRRLADRRIGLDLTEEARAFLAEAGFDPVYGARPLKRTIQRSLETRIGRQIVAGEIADGSRIRVAVKDGALAITTEPPQAADESAGE